MSIGEEAVIDVAGLDALIRVLRELGYDTLGPVVRSGAVMPGPVTGVADLPAGYHDEQSPGRYRLGKGDDDLLFAWAVGPGSWKAELFPPTQELWHASVGDEGATVVEPGTRSRPMAIIGARPCEVAALGILDKVLWEGAVSDPIYDARRSGAFVVTAECGSPASTCFCTSMDTGPAARGGFDLALSELSDNGGHRFVVRVGTDRGAEVLSQVPTVRASTRDSDARNQMIAAASAAMTRTLPVEGLADVLAATSNIPDGTRWPSAASPAETARSCVRPASAAT